jgi:hypothetical protein
MENSATDVQAHQCPKEVQRLLRVAVAAHLLTEEMEHEIVEAFDSVEHWLDSFVRLHERALAQG